MPIKALGAAERKQRVGVVVCLTHGPCCKKHPDHPAVQERKRRNDELSKGLVETVQVGHLLGHMRELADAGYEVPEEFTRGADDWPRGDRVRLFFKRYDLGTHFGSDEPYVEPPCKTRKLSDEQIRQRSEWAKAVREARSKRNQPDPTPPWEEADPEADRKLADMLSGLGDEADPEYRAFRESQERARREEEAERAALVQRLKADEELGRKMREALATWVNSTPRNSRHTQDVREGYGNAVPEFEEE